MKLQRLVPIWTLCKKMKGQRTIQHFIFYACIYKKRGNKNYVLFVCTNRPFYSCLLSDLAFEWQRG